MIDTFCKECAYAPKSDECHTCVVSCFDGEPMGLPSNFKRKPQPQTNADHIRAMSDEELGIFLGEWAAKPWAWKRDGEGECLVWLKQPAKEGE